MRSIITLFAAMIALQAGYTQTQLEGYFPMNGSATDLSYNNEEAVLYGDVAPTTDRFGNLSGALSFDGQGDYVTVNNDYDYELRTVNLWFKADNVTSLAGIIFNSDHAGLQNGTTNFAVRLENGIPTLRVNVGGGGGPEITEIQEGKWYMATIIAGSTYSKFYLDGEQFGQKPRNYGNSIDGTEDVVLGATRKFDRFFDGAIDDVRVYSRTLSEDEIEKLYNRNSCLIAHYRFENDYTDSSFNEFHASGTNLKFTEDRYGQSDGAAEFDGQGYAELPSDFDLAIRSVNVWFKAEEEKNGHIYNSDADNIVNGRTILAADNITTNQLSLKYQVGEKEYYEPVDTGKWYMATITVTPDSSKYYLNGELLRKRSFSSANSIDGMEKALIGTSRYLDEKFIGVVDEVAVYNCELSASEIEDKYSSFVGMERIAHYETRINISPNPTNGPLTIEVPSEIAQCRVSLVDLAGREHGSFYIQGGGNGHVDLSAMNKGVYILRFDYENQSTYRKIILN